jgi:hypothetical protein
MDEDRWLSLSRIEATEDLHTTPLSDLRVHRAACEAVLASGRVDEALDQIYRVVLDELGLRGEL